MGERKLKIWNGYNVGPLIKRWTLILRLILCLMFSSSHLFFYRTQSYFIVSEMNKTPTFHQTFVQHVRLFTCTKNKDARHTIACSAVFMNHNSRAVPGRRHAVCAHKAGERQRWGVSRGGQTRGSPHTSIIMRRRKWIPCPTWVSHTDSHTNSHKHRGQQQQQMARGLFSLYPHPPQPCGRAAAALLVPLPFQHCALTCSRLICMTSGGPQKNNFNHYLSGIPEY